MTPRWPGLRRIVALTTLEVRRRVPRAALGLVPGFVMLGLGLLLGNPSKGLLALAGTFAAVGGMLGPMLIVSDRQDGALRYFESLCAGRTVLALGRYVPDVLFSVLSVGLGMAVLDIAIRFGRTGAAVPPSALVAVGTIVTVCLLFISFILTPLFARLHPIIAILLPASAVVIGSQFMDVGTVAAHFVDFFERRMQEGFTGGDAVIGVILGWGLMGGVFLLLVRLTGRMLQRRRAPSARAMAMITAYHSLCREPNSDGTRGVG